MVPRFCFTGNSPVNGCGSDAIDSLELLVLPPLRTGIKNFNSENDKTANRYEIIAIEKRRI